MSRVRSFVSVLVLVVAVLALAGCQGLAQALGTNPAATTPAYNGIGVVAHARLETTQIHAAGISEWRRTTVMALDFGGPATTS